MRDRPTNETLLAYVNGNLPTNAAAEIERLMASDEGLSVEIGELQMLAQNGQAGADRLQAHQDVMRAAIRELPTSSSTPISPRIWLAAAAVCLLAAIGISLYVNTAAGGTDAGELLAWKEVPAVRSAETESALQSALESGTKEKWGKAAQALEVLSKSEPARAELQLYLGRALLLDGQQELGIISLTKVIDNPNFLPKTRLDAQWYRALGYLYGDNCKAAQLDFEEISQQVGTARSDQIIALTQSCL